MHLFLSRPQHSQTTKLPVLSSSNLQATYLPSLHANPLIHQTVHHQPQYRHVVLCAMLFWNVV